MKEKCERHRELQIGRLSANLTEVKTTAPHYLQRPRQSGKIQTVIVCRLSWGGERERWWRSTDRLLPDENRWKDGACECVCVNSA